MKVTDKCVVQGDRIKGHWFSLFGETDTGTVELSKVF